MDLNLDMLTGGIIKLVNILAYFSSMCIQIAIASLLCDPNGICDTTDAMGPYGRVA